jgi:hypothetical protein
LTNALLGSNRYVRFNTGGLLRGSVKEQYEAHRIALGGSAWKAVNEVRALDELPPLEGGDVLQTPLNMGNPGSLPGDQPADDGEDAVKAAEALVESVKESRCPDCGKLYGRGLTGVLYCARCKAEKVLV